MQSYARRGIEKEYWVLRKTEHGYTSLDIRDSKKIGRVLAECGGSWEYQWNVFELKTFGQEETDTKLAEQGLQKRQQKIIQAIKEIDKNAVIVCAGTYPGRDDPNIDDSELSVDSEPSSDGEPSGINSANAFWGEFNIACPADAFTRFTTADQLSISMNSGKESENVKLYNRLAGLSPLFIYCFSTSSCIKGIPLDVWSRRQQLIDAKGLQSGHIFPGTFPLQSFDQYQQALCATGDILEKKLASLNPQFFCKNGQSPREIVKKYRGDEWSFYKMLTQQVIRLNQKDSIPGYLEIRAIDSQECIKMTVALSHMGEMIATANDELEKILPQTEDELRYNLSAAIYNGEQAQIIVGGKSFSLPEYAQQVAEILFANDDYYSDLLRERFLNPPAKQIRKLLHEKRDLVQILSTCLENNKTISEVL